MASKGERLTNIRNDIENIDGTVFFVPNDEKAIDDYKVSLKTKEAAKAKEYASYYQPMDIIEAMQDYDLMDSVVPACCSQGCMVEPDGKCEHGHPSILLDNGMI